MTTTPDALAAQYVGRHRNLSPALAADMKAELTEWLTYASGAAEPTEREKLELQLLTQIFS